jgi:hypothetical protein
VFGAVGAVEALGEDDEICAGAGGFEDFGAGGGEVGGFVCAGAELDQGEFEGFGEEFGGHCGGEVEGTEVFFLVQVSPRRFVQM